MHIMRRSINEWQLKVEDRFNKEKPDHIVRENRKGLLKKGRERKKAKES